jgi:hypothetical protein
MSITVVCVVDVLHFPSNVSCSVSGLSSYVISASQRTLNAADTKETVYSIIATLLNPCTQLCCRFNGDGIRLTRESRPLRTYNEYKQRTYLIPL